MTAISQICFVDSALSQVEAWDRETSFLQKHVGTRALCVTLLALDALAALAHAVTAVAKTPLAFINGTVWVFTWGNRQISANCTAAVIAQHIVKSGAFVAGGVASPFVGFVSPKTDVMLHDALGLREVVRRKEISHSHPWLPAVAAAVTGLGCGLGFFVWRQLYQSPSPAIPGVATVTKALPSLPQKGEEFVEEVVTNHPTPNLGSWWQFGKEHLAPFAIFSAVTALSFPIYRFCCQKRKSAEPATPRGVPLEWQKLHEKYKQIEK